ncbi:MAG: hypothetical protein J2P36_23580 [Ktedonobacteraceae bacterium]|nr:hypothetical protein [Ktedonobacteraceae bacterium]
MERKRGPKPKAAPAGYVRYGAALELFQPFDKNAFNYRVRSGDIQTQEDAHGKLYEINSIQQVKEYLSSERKKEVYQGKFLIDWTRPEDFASGIKLDMQVYDLDIALADAATYQSWRKNNNNRLSIAAFSEDRSERFASIKLMPLKDEQTAIDILSNKRSENDLQPDEIRNYDEPGPYIILAIDAVALPEHPYLLNTILRKWMDFWVEQYPDRYIKRIYTQAVSESGYRMVQHFFMSPRLDLAQNAFMLDMAYPSASKLVRNLQNRLKEKAPLPPDLQPPLIEEK